MTATFTPKCLYIPTLLDPVKRQRRYSWPSLPAPAFLVGVQRVSTDLVALIGDEATVKRYFPEKDYIRFQPENSAMAPILVRATDFRPTMLLGVVVGLYRRL